MTATTSIAALAAPPAGREAPALAPPPPGAPTVAHRGVTTIVLDRVAKGLRGARARTGLSEADVVAILARQGIALDTGALRTAEATGVIALDLAACLADIYGTTTDGLAGRRLHRKRPSLDDFPSDS
jgi:hypothetical protein